ncbi:hypothetical protein [Niastella vici]|uniref:hypothetical protein n=1 Tax=Niastella vici TaxID=1703345 RepID=UPI0009C10D46|nr:hypothetical protein [Niastella vici]
MKIVRWSLLLLTTLVAACRHQPKPLSFYYWKTQFTLNDYERSVLKNNGVKSLYVRYFDVDLKPEDNQPSPVSPVHLDTAMQGYRIIPVVFIRNRTFERLQPADIPTLAQHVFALVAQINQSQHIATTEIQFDCDWTERTRDKFFQFIQQYRAITSQTISSTIRLHQIKYKDKTGVPPVDYGVLMYYNMGAISGDNTNSIYERSVASRYNTYIKTYPLPMDVALPIFSWGQTIRNGKVVELLNKTNITQFENDSNFTRLNKTRFITKHACFNGGYYFKEKDEIKLEQVSADDLLDITTQINQNTNHRIGKLIFYDLDSTNLVQYEKDIFKKVLNHFN